MKNSVYKVFSLYKRCDFIFYKGNFEAVEDIYAPVSASLWDNANDFIKTNCTRIYNQIENFWYSYDDFALMMKYDCLFNQSVALDKLDKSFYDSMMMELSKLKFNEDKKLLIEVNKKIGLPDINSFFYINPKGDSIVYDLIMKKAISPIFFIKYIDLANKCTRGEHVKFEKNKEYRKFEKQIKILKDHLINKEEQNA